MKTRNVIYRIQRTVTDVRTKEWAKAHIRVCGEIARVKGKRFWIFKLPDRYICRTWLMEHMETEKGTYVSNKCGLRRLSYESVKRVREAENRIKEELKAKCHEYKKKCGKAE